MVHTGCNNGEKTVLFRGSAAPDVIREFYVRKRTALHALWHILENFKDGKQSLLRCDAFSLSYPVRSNPCWERAGWVDRLLHFIEQDIASVWPQAFVYLLRQLSQNGRYGYLPANCIVYWILVCFPAPVLPLAIWRFAKLCRCWLT